MGTNQSGKLFCTTTLNYIGRKSATASSEVPVYDGRAADLPSWEVCGFELMKHASAVANWDDDDQIARVHYPEISELAKKLSGCDHALVAGHIKRNPRTAKQHHQLSPITVVHSDFAASYGELIRNSYRDGAREAAAEKAGLTADDVANVRRLMIVQFWRNLGPAKMDMPLAFCDARSVKPDEVRAFPVKNYAGSGFDFEALGVVAPDDPADHRWYVYPEMQADEVVVFRTYDSDRVGTEDPFWTPHGAIRDPEVEPGKPARSSIELRATCLFL